MTSWAVPRKQYNTRLRISLEVPVLKAVFFKLGTGTVHHKRTKRNRKMTLIMLLP